MATKQTHLPAVSHAQLTSMATAMAVSLADTGKAIEDAKTMEEQIKKAQESLKSTRKQARDGLAALNIQIREIHRLGLDFGKVPLRKITFAQDETTKEFIVPDNASLAEILFHKFIQLRGIEPGHAYNLTSLVKFCCVNGTLLDSKVGYSYNLYLEKAKKEGVPAIGGHTQVFAKHGKDTWVKVLAPPAPTVEAKPTETKAATKDTKDTKDTKAGTAAPTVDESSLRGRKEKSFLDHLLAAAVDNAGLGNILLAFAQACDKEPETVKSRDEAFNLFIQVLADLKLVVKNGNKVSKVTK